MPRKPEARFLRDIRPAFEEELETSEYGTDSTELAGLSCTFVGEAASVICDCSMANELRAGLNGVLWDCDRSLLYIWSRDVLEGAEVTLVDCVSCERTELWSLSSVIVESALEMLCGGQRN